MKKTKPQAPRESDAKRPRLSAEEFAALLRSVQKEQADNGLAPEQALRAAGVSDTIMLVGSEQLRVKRLLGWIRKNIFDESAAKQSVETCFGSEISSASSVARLKENLLSLSLFSASKLVIVYQADKIKAQFLKDLLPAFARHSETIVLLLTVGELGSKTAALNDLAKKSTLVEVSQLSGNQLRRWIEREAVQAGAEGIEPQAVEVLLSSHGDDITRLSQELGKLSLLTPHGAKISAALAQDISLKTPERTSFELIEQISRKGIANALALTNDLLAQGQHPLQLSSFLSRCLRIMLAQKTLGPEASLPPELGNQWFARNLRPATQAFSAEDLTKSLALLRDVDLKLKSSGLEAESVITSCIQRMALRSFRDDRSELLQSTVV